MIVTALGGWISVCMSGHGPRQPLWEESAKKTLSCARACMQPHFLSLLLTSLQEINVSHDGFKLCFRATPGAAILNKTS